MGNINRFNLRSHNVLLSKEKKDRLNESLALLKGISRLPLKNNTELAKKIKKIYGEAEELEKS